MPNFAIYSVSTALVLRTGIIPDAAVAQAQTLCMSSDEAIVCPCDPAVIADGFYSYNASEAVFNAGSPPPPLITVPSNVSMAQAKMALFEAGLLDKANALIAAMPMPVGEEVQIWWQYSQDVSRDNQFVAQLGGALGQTSAQLDQLFILAASISPDAPMQASATTTSTTTSTTSTTPTTGG